MKIECKGTAGEGIGGALCNFFPSVFVQVDVAKMQPDVLDDSTTVLGKATRDVSKFNLWLESKGVPEYAEMFRDAGERWGVRWDIAIFQMCLETGFFRFGGDVKKEQNNFFGIGAIGGGAAGDTFKTPAEGVEAQMQNLALRAGGNVPREVVIAPHVSKNYGIISKRGTSRWAQLAGTYAADVKYWEKIKAIAKEFDAWEPGAKPATIGEKKRIGLDAGHSEQRPGARSKFGAKEEILTRQTVNKIKLILESTGKFVCEIVPTLGDDLTARGSRSKYYDAFVSSHFNSYAGDADPGSECLIDNDKGTEVSARLAKLICDEHVKALGTKNRGVKRQGLSILDAAELAVKGKNVPCVLVESFFLNPYNQGEAEQRAQIAAGAIANGIKQFFGE